MRLKHNNVVLWVYEYCMNDWNYKWYFIYMSEIYLSLMSY